MSTAALLGLESSKSYQSLKQIQGSLRELFEVRAQDQKSEENFYKQTSVEARRQAEDTKKFDRGSIKTAHDYERAVKSGGGSGMAAGAGILAVGLLGAALMGKTNAMKRLPGKVFDRGSDFVKNFTDNFNKELDKEENDTSTTSSTPSSTTSSPPSSEAKPEPKVSTAPSGGKVTKKQAAQLASEAGFSKSEAKIMGAIAMGESSGRVGVVNDNPNTKDLSYGLWQINMIGDLGPYRRKKFGLSSNDDLKDPKVNARVAYAIFKEAGFEAWGAYTNGSYRKYLQKGGAAVLSHAQGNGPEGENKLALKTALNPQIMDGKQPTINLPGFQRGGKIFLHWAASGYNSNFPQNYHTVFKGDGTAQRNQSYSRFRTRKGHTWRRNGQGVGLSMASMGGDDPWSTPTTDAQVNAMASEIAKIAKDWGWKKEDINSQNVMTHAEVAKIDGYFGERWDLWHIKKNDPKGSGGERIRQLARAKFDGSASATFQGPAAEEQKRQVVSGDTRDSEGDGRERGEQDRDAPTPRSEMNQPVEDTIQTNFKQYGPFGQMVLDIARKFNKAAGFELIPGVGTGEPAPNNIQAQEKQVAAITQPQPQAAPGSAQQQQDAKQEKEPTKAEAKKNVETLKSNAEALKNISKASHPNTGSGYTIKGLKDYKGRPAVFSQAAAYHYGNMMKASGGKMKGTDISSTQRSRSYNAALPGAHPNSSHLYGEAIDVIGSSMEYMKAHGKKYGWHYGYSHGPNSAHFNYKGPEKLQIQGKQAGGTVHMKQSGGIAQQFNGQHEGSFIRNKYGRKTVVIKKAAPTPDMGGSRPLGNTDYYKHHMPSPGETATSMFKIQMGAFV